MHSILCALSPSHSLLHTHTFFSSCSPLTCTFLLKCVSDCVVSCLGFCVVCSPMHNSLIPASQSFSWISWLWPSLKATHYHEVEPMLASICVLWVWMCSFVHVCVAMATCACMFIWCVKCVKQIEDFFEDLLGRLEGDSGVCYCIFRRVCEGLLR